MKKTTAYARKRSHQDAWQRTRHEACNPVTEAVVPCGMAHHVHEPTGHVGYPGSIAAHVCLQPGLGAQALYVAFDSMPHHGFSDGVARLMPGALPCVLMGAFAGGGRGLSHTRPR